MRSFDRRQGKGLIQLCCDDSERMTHTVFSACGQCIERSATKLDAIGTQHQGTRYIRPASEAAVDQYCTTAFCCLHDSRQALYARKTTIQLATAMVRDDDPVDAHVDCPIGLCSIRYAFEYELPGPHIPKPPKVAP